MRIPMLLRKNNIKLAKLIPFFVLVLGFFVFKGVLAANYWVTDPTDCPSTSQTYYPGQNCDDLDICGALSGNVAQCYDTSGIVTPSVTGTSDTIYTGSLPSGYILDCFATDSNVNGGYCSNNGDWWCNASSTCSDLNRETDCAANQAGVATCGGCSADAHACDGSFVDADGCEIQDGTTCVSSDGLIGVYDNCNGTEGFCKINSNYFETGVNVRYATSSSLLWGTQYGSGNLMELSASNTPGGIFTITNDGRVGIGTSTLGANNMLTVGLDSGSQFIVSKSGVVTGGSWQAGIIGLAYGGTGLDFSTSTGFLYLSNGTSTATTSIYIGNTDLAVANSGGSTLLSYVGNTITLDTAGNWMGTVEGIDISSASSTWDATTNAVNTNTWLADADFVANGLMIRTANGTYANRTATGTDNQIIVTNGDGVSGNPTFALASSVYLGVSGLIGRDSNNYVDFSTVNQIGFKTNGTNRMVLDANGNLGIGTTTPAYKLSVNGELGENLFQVATSTNTGIFTINASGNVGIGTTTNPSGYKLNVGGSLNVSNSAYINGSIRLYGTSGSYAVNNSYSNSDTAWHGTFNSAYRSRGTYSLPTVLSSGDSVMYYDQWGYDGNSYDRGAQFKSVIDGAVSDSIVPIGWEWTTMNTAGVYSTKFKIGSSGLVTINQNLIVSGTGNTTIAGPVGIGTTTPSQMLTVGATSSQQFLVNNIGQVVGGTWMGSAITNTYIASSSIWNTTTNTVNASSSNWTTSYDIVNASSSDWNTTTNTVNANSSNWNTAYNIVNASSTDWQNTYNTVTSNTWLADSDFASNGLMIRTANGTYANRTATGTDNQIIVTNGDGVSGNPIFALASSVYLGTSGRIGRDSNNYIDYSTANQIGLKTNGTTKMTLDANGYLGIGISGPQAVLDVWGTSTQAIMSSEMITDLTNDGNFGSDTGHWATNSQWIIASSTNLYANHTATGTGALSLANAYLSAAPVYGSYYQVSFSINTTVIGSVAISFGSTALAARGQQAGASSDVQVVQATGADVLTFTPNSTWTGYVDNISIKKITSSNATQIVRNSNGSIGLEIRSGGSGLTNTFIGVKSGLNNTIGSNNTATGNYSLYSNTTGSSNTANGMNSLNSNTTGSSNTANGMYSLNSNTTGSYNTANGMYSLLFNTTGSNNTANGYLSLRSNTTGSYNTANGNQSLYSNTTGHSNIANGYMSLYSNTTGFYNAAHGHYSLYYNTTGAYNTVNGIQSLYFNTTGSSNTANGYMSLAYNTTGSSNTADGYFSGYYMSTSTGNIMIGNEAAKGAAAYTGSDYNTIIGYQAGYNIGSNQSRNVLLGYQAGYNVTGSDKLYIANGSADSNVLIYGDFANHMVGIGTTTPGYVLDVQHATSKVNSKNGYLTNGADYAEYFYTNDIDLASGETVCIDVAKDNTVMRCVRGADNNVMGIVSTNPSIVGNGNGVERDNDPHYKIIGMLGQVPALVTNDNGPINPGDSLTSASTTPGFLMRANAGDSTVGIALESFDSSAGRINVLISRRNKSLTVETVEAEVSKRIADMAIEDDVRLMISDSLASLNVDDQIKAVVANELNIFDSRLTLKFDAMSGQIINLEEKYLDHETRLAYLENNFVQASTTMAQMQEAIDVLSEKTIDSVEIFDPYQNASTTVLIADIVASQEVRILDLQTAVVENTTSITRLESKVMSIEERMALLEENTVTETSSTSDVLLESIPSDDSIFEIVVAKLNLFGIFISDKIIGVKNLIADLIDTREIKITQTEIAAENVIGEGMIPAGATSTVIISNKIATTSKLFVTFRGDYGSRWWIGDLQNGSSTLVIAEPLIDDIYFDWWVIGVNPVIVPVATTTEEIVADVNDVIEEIMNTDISSTTEEIVPTMEEVITEELATTTSEDLAILSETVATTTP